MTGRSRALRAAVLVAVAFVAYVPALRIGFLHDDFFEYLHPVRFDGLGPALVETWTPKPGEAFYRPLVNTTLLVTAAVVGPEAIWFRATDLVLHAAVVLLAAACASRLVDRRVGFVTGLLFAVHPLPGRAILWTSDRYVVLATLFSFVALLAFLRWRRTGSIAVLVGALAAHAAALCSKESALAVPVALAVVAWVWGGMTPLVALRSVVGFIALDLAYLGLRYAAYGDLGGYRAPDGSPLAPLGFGRVAVEALVDLPLKCVWPFNRDRVTGWVEIALGGALVAGLAWIAVHARRPRARDVVGGIALGYAWLLPSLPYFYIGRDLLKGYHIYPVALGFGIAAAAAFASRARARAVGAAFAGMLAIWAVVDHLHARSWIEATRQVRAFGAWVAAIEPPLGPEQRVWVAGLPHVMRGALLLEPNRMRTHLEVLVDHRVGPSEGLGHPWTRATSDDVVASMRAGARLLRWDPDTRTGREIRLDPAPTPRTLVRGGRATAGAWAVEGETRSTDDGLWHLAGRDGRFRWRGTAIDQARYRTMRIEMRARVDGAPRQVCNVRWTGSHYSPGRIKRLGRLPIVADGTWRTYELDLVRTGWIGESLAIETLTIAPASVPIDAAIRSVELVPW